MSDLVESISLWLPSLLVMLALVCCSAFFSASETAFFFLSRDELQRFRTGTSGQRVVSELMEDPDRLLTAVLFWNLLINLAYFSVGVVASQALASSGYQVVATILAFGSLIGMIIFGEVAPKTAAALFRQKLSSIFALPLSVAVRVLDPVIPVLSTIATVLRRTFWPHVQQELSLQPEDLERAIDSSAAHARALKNIEQRVLHNIMDLGEVSVEEVMRPRNLCIVVDASQKISECRLTGIQNQLFVLVRDEDDESENYTRAVSLQQIKGDSDVTFGEIAEPVKYFPWCATLTDVLEELRTRNSSVVLVVHEYGEIQGSVCYEDVLDFLFCESHSRTRRILGRDPILRIADNRFHAEGLVNLRLLYQTLRIPFDPDKEALTTLAGLFHDELERMPVEGDRIQVEGWNITAIQADSQGRLRALIEPAGPGPVDPQESPE